MKPKRPISAREVEPHIRTIRGPSAPDRPEFGLGLAAAAALLGPAISVAFGSDPAWLPGLNSVWRAAHLSNANTLDSGALTGVLATQAMLLIGITLLWRAIAVFGPQSGWFLPEWRADCQARDLCYRAGPGVLFYIADAQNTVRVLADPDTARRLPAGALEAARDALVEGMGQGDEVRAFASARVALRRAG